MAKHKTLDWHGQDWTNPLPLWHDKHPLWKFVDARRVYRNKTVEIDGAMIIVGVPNLGDEPLETIIASFAVADIAERLPRVATIAALEPIAALFDYEWDDKRGCFNDDQPGTGTPETSRPQRCRASPSCAPGPGSRLTAPGRRRQPGRAVFHLRSRIRSERSGQITTATTPTA